MRITLTLVLLGLAVGASLADGLTRIWLAVAALTVIAAYSGTLPAPRELPHPALQGAIVVIGGVGIIAAAFGIFLVFVLSGASTPVLIGVALLLAALAAFLATRYSSST